MSSFKWKHQSSFTLEKGRWGGGINLYHECGYNGYGVPINKGGGGDAKSGQAYSDLILWINNEVFTQHYEGNFLGTSLTSSLEAGQKYNVELYISLWDSMYYAVKNIGVYLSIGQPENNLATLLSLVPQINNGNGITLSDKLGWMRIAGSFIADGGENFLTIGNFDGYNNSFSEYVGNGGVPPVDFPFYWEASYYYIDDVSVIEDTSYHVGVNEHLAIDNQQLSFYPNPTTDVLTIEVALNGDRTFELLDMQDRVALRQGMQAERQNIDVSQLPTGVYVAVLRQKGVAVARRKMVIQR